MKSSRWLVAVLAGGLMASSVWAFETPSDEQIGAILADHTQMDALVAGATPQQLASVVQRALDQLKGSTLTAGELEQTSALIYTRALLLAGEGAPAMVESLAAGLDQKLVPVVAASTAVAVGSTEGPVFAALAKTPGVSAEAVAGAAADPAGVLSEDSLVLVQQLVIELRGVAAAVIPPPATAPMNLVPPVVPRNTQGPAQPPVAQPYGNQ